jgi:hypothetical protein
VDWCQKPPRKTIRRIEEVLRDLSRIPDGFTDDKDDVVVQNSQGVVFPAERVLAWIKDRK